MQPLEDNIYLKPNAIQLLLDHAVDYFLAWDQIQCENRPDGECVYRGITGLGFCMIGYTIPDELYSDEFESHSAVAVLDMIENSIGISIPEDVKELATALQEIHDTKLNQTHIKQTLLNLAKEYGLDPSYVEEKM